MVVAAAFIGVLALVNFRGIKESVQLNLGLTAIELTGLALVVVIGATFLFDGGGDPARAFEFKAGEAVPLAILSGASLAFFALIGFEDSVNVAEETKEPSRVFPKALFAGLAIALTVYILVTLVAGMAVPTDQLAGSDGPLLEVVQLGPLAMNTKVFSAIALFALANGALINMIMASRLIYGMAQQGIVPQPMGRVHGERRTPWVAIIFVAALALALCAVGDLESLADTTVLLLLGVFVSVNIAVLDPAARPGGARALARPDRAARARRAGLPRADRPEGVRRRDHLRLRRRAHRPRRRPLPDQPRDGGAGPGARPRQARRLGAYDSRVASSSIVSTAPSALEIGQISLAWRPTSWNVASSTPGTRPTVRSLIRLMAKPSPSLRICTSASVCTDSALWPASSSSAANCIEKQDACAAATSSSGFVAPPSPSSVKREVTEYRPLTTSDATANVPSPSWSPPFHSAVAFLVAMWRPLRVVRFGPADGGTRRYLSSA